MNRFVQFYAFLHLRAAVRMADAAYKEKNHRFYVIGGDKCRLVVTDRKNFRLLRSKHYIRNQELKTVDLEILCFYHTPHANGNRAIEEDIRQAKVVEYYKWYADCRRETREKRRAARKKRPSVFKRLAVLLRIAMLQERGR